MSDSFEQLCVLYEMEVIRETMREVAQSLLLDGKSLSDTLLIELSSKLSDLCDY